MTIRSEIRTKNIRSLGFQDTRERFTLHRVDIVEFRVYDSMSSKNHEKSGSNLD